MKMIFLSLLTSLSLSIRADQDSPENYEKLVNDVNVENVSVSSNFSSKSTNFSGISDGNVDEKLFTNVLVFSAQTGVNSAKPTESFVKVDIQGNTDSNEFETLIRSILGQVKVEDTKAVVICYHDKSSDTRVLEERVKSLEKELEEQKKANKHLAQLHYKSASSEIVGG